MFVKLREVLLTQYIGAFLIALLVWQALGEVISQIVRSGYWFYYSQRSLATYSRGQYRWDTLVLSAVKVTIYLVVAYALGTWLYRPETPQTTGNAEEALPSNSPERP